MAIRKRINKDGKVTGWQVTVEGVRGPNGERKRFSKTVRTKQEAKDTELEMLNQLSNGGIQKTNSMTTEVWMNTWLSTYKPNIERSTRVSYKEKMKNYTIPLLGKIPISKLTPNNIQTLVAFMQKEGKSSRTIRNTFVNINDAMKKAVELHMIPFNPCAGVVLPKIESSEVNVYDDTEIKAALNAAKGTDIYLLVLLGFATGLRRGELGAIKWEHIDLEKGYLNIVENQVSAEGEVITKAPKTAASKRRITISKDFCKLLRQAKEEYEEQKANYGPAFCKDGYVIHKKDGSRFHPDSISQKWRRFIKKHNLKEMKLHGMRHSCATSMIASHVDYTTVQHRLGHASSKTTMDYYAHCTPAMDQSAANVMDKIIKP